MFLLILFFPFFFLLLVLVGLHVLIMFWPILLVALAAWAAIKLTR